MAGLGRAGLGLAALGGGGWFAGLGARAGLGWGNPGRRICSLENGKVVSPTRTANSNKLLVTSNFYLFLA